jgi:predicted amidohydrolase
VMASAWPAKRVAHWRLLAQARAVENQMYVLACNTAGTHAGVAMGGHSMVVDPWGAVLAEAGEDEDVLVADVDLGSVAATRSGFPVLADRRLGAPATRRDERFVAMQPASLPNDWVPSGVADGDGADGD